MVAANIASPTQWQPGARGTDQRQPDQRPGPARGQLRWQGPSYTYTTAGIYQAKLKVTDGRGLVSDPASVTITAGNPPPTAVIDTPASTVTRKAGYFANQTLSGTAVGERWEAAVDYDWGSGVPPESELRRQLLGPLGQATQPRRRHPRVHRHRRCRVRVYLDGTLIIDQWKDPAANHLHGFPTGDRRRPRT